MQKSLVFILLLISSLSAFADQPFFSARGDQGFKHLSERKLHKYCRKLPCLEMDNIFFNLETITVEKFSDQDVLGAIMNDAKVEKKRLSIFLKVAQQKGLLDSIQYQILDQKYDENSEPTFLLYAYKRKLNSLASYTLRQSVANDFELLNSKKFRNRIKLLKELSARQRLYALYSPIQIAKMAQVINDNLKVIYSDSAMVSIDYDGNGVSDREEELSTGERYRLGLKLLVRDFYRLKSSGLFTKTQPSLIDCLIAGLELGIIDKDVLNEVMSIEQLDLLPKNFWQRHQHVFKSLLRVGAFSLPGVGPYIAVAIIISEAIIEGRRGYEQISQDHLF